MNYIIFGANGGLGKAFINLLSNSNDKIFLVYRKTKLKNNVYKCNIADPSSIKNTLLNIKKKITKIDFIINCSGYFEYDKKNLNKKDLLKFFQINTFPLIYLNILSNKLNLNVENIITIGSSSSYEFFNLTNYYCASKMSLIPLIKNFNYLNKKRKNYIFSMGTMDTRMGKKIRNKIKRIDPCLIAKLILIEIKNKKNKNRELFFDRKKNKFNVIF